MSAYEAVAGIYDRLMSEVDYDKWFRNYVCLLGLSRIEVNDLLEIGCGTGLMTSRFAQYFDVTAVDYSKDMLEQAKIRRIDGRHSVTWAQADMLTLSLDRTFDAAVAVFDVFNHALSLPALEQVLDRVRHHLRPHGRLLFDVNSPYAFEAHLFDEEYHSPDGQEWHSWRGDWDAERQLVTVDMTFFDHGKRFEERHVQRAHTLHEIRMSLQNTHFSHIAILDAEQMQPPIRETDRFLVSAERSD